MSGMGINTKQKYWWYNKTSEEFMGRGYFHNNSSIEDRVEAISKAVGEYYPEVQEKVKSYIELGYYILPSPVWSNFGTNRGSGISCFNTHIGDSVQSILKGTAEVGMLSKIGGGTSGYFGDIRPEGSSISTGGIADGPMAYIKLFSEVKNIMNQGSFRRGEFAAFLDIDHKDIMKFLDINRENSEIQRLPYGVCVSDDWIQSMKSGDRKKREVWAKVLENKGYTGFPYIFYTDNVNRGTVDVYKDLGLKIKSTNMCTEILLPSSETESFVCNLIGMNIEMFDYWKHTDAVRVALYLADAVLNDFIRKNKNNPLVERAVRFAENHRAIGIGASGYHSYLQENMIPFESIAARSLNNLIFKTIRDQAYQASREMFELYGASEMMSPYKRRHSCLLAIAPNTSSSMIMGQQSQSIEPFIANAYVRKTNKISILTKNPTLFKLLELRGKNTPEILESILKKGGSVQHLDFLTKEEKEVFKTMGEISQLEIITQASQRQVYIDQGQSLNLMISADSKLSEINDLYLQAHEMGIKTLYYQLTTNAAQDFKQNLLECTLCAG